MKAILKSIRPRHIMNILNGIKDLELSTTAPKDWLDYFNKKTDKKPDPRPVLMYCTKSRITKSDERMTNQKLFPCEIVNGKVIGMFTLNQIYVQRMTTFSNAEQAFEMAKRACLTTDEFFAYQKDKTIYAWKIDDLVVFDKPKELSEFRKPYTLSCEELNKIGLPIPLDMYNTAMKRGKYFITKAPQNWCYVEV